MLEVVTALKSQVLKLRFEVARLEARADALALPPAVPIATDAEHTPLPAVPGTATDDSLLECAQKHVLASLRFLSPLQTARFTEFLERVLAQYPKA